MSKKPEVIMYTTSDMKYTGTTVSRMTSLMCKFTKRSKEEGLEVKKLEKIESSKKASHRNLKHYAKEAAFAFDGVEYRFFHNIANEQGYTVYPQRDQETEYGVRDLLHLILNNEATVEQIDIGDAYGVIFDEIQWREERWDEDFPSHLLDDDFDYTLDYHDEDQISSVIAKVNECYDAASNGDESERTAIGLWRLGIIQDLTKNYCILGRYKHCIKVVIQKNDEVYYHFYNKVDLKEAK